MTQVVRYFDASAAGAGDGTTFADRAAFVSAGVVSTVITGFNFSGSDSLECRIVGGNTYTVTTSLVTATFANPPTAANQLTFHGCDSSGNRLAIPDSTWTSDEPAWTDTTLPVIATTTNILTANVSHLYLRLVKLTASGRNGAVITLQAGLDWCVVVNSTANTSATTLTALFSNAANCVLSCTGSSYSSVVPPTNGDRLWNCRIVGNAGSSGNRHGVAYAGTTMPLILVRCTVINNGGVGVIYTSSNTAISLSIDRCVIAGNASDGVQMPNTASQSMRTYIDHCMITGNGGYGVNPVGANTNIIVTQSRLRDNTSGNFGTWGNQPQNLDNYTTDSDDATEYVNSGSGNYQIKTGATIHGSGYGVSEQVSGGTTTNVIVRRTRQVINRIFSRVCRPLIVPAIRTLVLPPHTRFVAITRTQKAKPSVVSLAVAATVIPRERRSVYQPRTVIHRSTTVVSQQGTQPIITSRRTVR